MWWKNFKNSFFLEIWWFVFRKKTGILRPNIPLKKKSFSLRWNFKPKKEKKTTLVHSANKIENKIKPCFHDKGNYARLVTPSPPTTRQNQFGAPVCCTGCTCVACLRDSRRLVWQPFSFRVCADFTNLRIQGLINLWVRGFRNHESWLYQPRVISLLPTKLVLEHRR
jgi:hypothetical protein